MTGDFIGRTAFAAEGDGPTVVLIHGLGLARGMWDGQVAALSRRFRTLRYDLLGHGESARPRGAFEMLHFVAQLDETGTYAMHLDSGAYDFSVLPEAESGAPPTLLDNLDISETTQLDVDLPPASLAHITVDAPDGTPLPDVTIELYRSDDASTPPRVLVKGTTTSDGVVDLLVPHLP